MIRKANRMIFPFRHDARMPSKQDALTGVDQLAPVSRLHTSTAPLLGPLDSYPPVLVKPIQHVIDVAKVGYSIISAVMVDVINDVRLFAMHKEPSEAMSGKTCAVKANPDVPKALGLGASHLANLGSMVVISPRKHARIGIVAKDIADRIRYKFCSHVELPLSVVRGAVVGATVAPILTWEMSLAK